MTACRNKARGAVVAALAGALTLGAAPVMALADGASLMAANADQAFMAGTVTEFTVGNKKVSGNDAGEIKFGDLADSAIKITSVLPDAPGDPDEVDTSSYTTYYYKKLVKDDPLASHQINGEWYDYVGDSISSIKSPGEYVAAVTPLNTNIPSGEANNVRPTVSFTVVADETALQDAQLMKVVDTDVYSSDVTWEYGKTWQSLRVVAGGEDITAADTDTDGTNDIKVEVYATGQAGTDLWASDASIIPGSYQVVISGADGAYAGAKRTYEMTVGKLDLSKLGLYIADISDGGAPVFGDIVDRNGGTSVVSALMGSSNWVASNFDLTPADGKTWGTGDNGAYSFTLSLKDDAKVNGTGSKLADLVDCDVTLELNRVKYDKTVAWSYDGHEAGNVGGPASGTIYVDASLDEDSFSGIWQVSSLDLSKFAGSYVDENGKTVKLSGDQVEKTIYDADGNVVDSMSKKGVYYVVLECDPADFGYGVKRSTYTIKVTWKQGDVTNAGTTFTFDGKVVQAIRDQTYDGRDYLDRIGIQVRDDEGNLLEAGTDYQVTITKDGKEVDSIVDAGDYKISVASDKYAFAADENLTFKVKAFDISVAGSTRVTFPTAITYMDKDKGEQTFVPYTGSDIAPVVEVALTTDEDGEKVWTTLDSALYDFGFDFSKTYGGTYKDADSVKELGYYKVSAHIDGKATENFDGSFTSGIFKVSDQKVFVDVDSAEYYAPYVYTAVEQGYVQGMGGSNLFAPNASVSRADMVVILYRMAGGDVQDKNWTASPEETEYLSQFGDVKGNEYFAQALAWASRLGVVTGYEDGNFGPADSITVEQFATMLARYAKVAGSDMDVDADAVLGTVADGDQVSQFAEDAVAWAIDNGYLAQGGADIQPQSPVSRGRAITIAVRYQPEKLQDSPVSPVDTSAADAK